MFAWVKAHSIAALAAAALVYAYLDLRAQVATGG